MDRVFERVCTIQYECLERMLSYDVVGAVWVVDDIAYGQGLMVRPDYLRQYLFPWYRRIGDLARQRGLPLIYHSDGRLYKVLEDLIGCGFDALHPIEPKAMDIAYLKREFGRRLCLIGNIDLSYTLTLGTPEEVEAEVRERLREIAPGGGYCVGSSNTVANYVPLENYNAMREATFRYGRYSISVDR